MENLDKTMFTSNKEDLQKIYDEEAKKLRENEFKLNVLRKLSIDDFPCDLPEASKRNIEKALLAMRIKNHITLDNGQKLLGEMAFKFRPLCLNSSNCSILGLEDFDTAKIALSYLEKKLIKEQVEQLINLEKRKQSNAPKDVTNELQKAQESFIELQKENTPLTEQLFELKKQEQELLRAVANEMVSSTQTKVVQGILDDAKIVMLQSKTMNQVYLESEMSRSQHYKKALAEVSGAIDQQLQLRGTASKK